MAQFVVDHPVSLYDQPIRIRLDGFRPDEGVEIVAKRQDLLGRSWTSNAQFKADSDGQVDLGTQASEAGTYLGVSAMGLFWSMNLDPGPASPGEPRKLMDGIDYQISARSLDTGEETDTRVRRLFAASGVGCRKIRTGSIVGNLYLPPGKGPHPAIIVLSGSGGGINAPQAALFASHGYAAFALGYFAMDGLPDFLAKILLEYFETAIAWLKGQPEIRDDFLAVTGISRGGELSLLLGAHIPDVRAVIGYVPSGVVHSGNEKSADGEWRTVASWTNRGEPIPYLQENNSSHDRSVIDWERPPFPLTPVFRSALRDKKALERATIPVERTNGSLLLISGTDDQMWPSTELAEVAMDRLRRRNHPHRFEHLVYEGAGHLIATPYAPTTLRHSHHPVAGVEFAFGGTTEADADAAIDSWPRVLNFLEEAATRAN